jgi:glycerol-3-phosphate dehydrogenase (NAD(P)+)
MTSKSLSEKDKPIGVIGAGNFGSVIANLLARQRNVLLYARNGTIVEHILAKEKIGGIKCMSELRLPTTFPQ